MIGEEVELPARLAAHLELERRVTPIEPVFEELKEILLDG